MNGRAVVWKRRNGRYDVWTMKLHTEDKADPLGVDLTKRKALKIAHEYNRALDKKNTPR